MRKTISKETRHAAIRIALANTAIPVRDLIAAQQGRGEGETMAYYKIVEIKSQEQLARVRAVDESGAAQQWAKKNGRNVIARLNGGTVEAGNWQLYRPAPKPYGGLTSTGNLFRISN